LIRNREFWLDRRPVERFPEALKRKRSGVPNRGSVTLFWKSSKRLRYRMTDDAQEVSSDLMRGLGPE
jgi:hypothetical protein